ncbi:MAG TPA: hypothetical protein VK974_04705 [Methylophilaceae bacterium]|nr:hypothetical protein [Methylophilaceae bacterium]
MADKFQLKAILSAVDRISPVLKNITRATRLTHKSIRDIGTAGGELMRKVGLPAFASFSAFAFGALRASAAAVDFAGSVQDSGERTGAAVDDFQAMVNMLGQVGGTVEDAEMSFTKFNKGIAEGAAGKDKGFAGLMSRLKIPLKDAKGNLQSLTGVLPDLADAFMKNEDPAKRTRMAMELFGKGGTKMIPILIKGKAAVAEWIKEQERLGAIITKESIGQLDDLGDAHATLQTQIKANIGNALAKLVPVIKPIIGSMSDWLAVNKEWLQAEIVSTITDIATAMRDVDWKAVAVDIRDTARAVASVVEMLGGLKGVVVGLGIAFIAGPIAAVLSIVGAVLRFGSALVVLVGGWSAIGAGIMTAIGWAGTLVKVLFLVGRAILTIGGALLATPLGIILALATAAYLVYTNWDLIKQWFVSFVAWLPAKIRAITQAFTGMIPDWVKNLFTTTPRVNVTGGAATPLQSSNALSSGRAQVNGEMTVRFENAPAGTRADAGKTNQPGFSLNPDVGYRQHLLSGH